LDAPLVSLALASGRIRGSGVGRTQVERFAHRHDIASGNQTYFMKPLISAMAVALGKTAPRSAAPR
jgi:hypothetical protein